MTDFNANGNTTHADVNTFKEYDAQLTIPAVEGYRSVKCLYKKNMKTGKIAGTNSYVRVADHITEEAVKEKLSLLMPHVIAYLQEEENKLVKVVHMTGASKIDPASISMDAVLAALEATGTSQRLNKEAVEEWFTGAVYEPLLVAFATKMGVSEEPTAEELEKLEQITTVYKAKFSALAGGKTAYTPMEAEMLLKALEVAGAGATSIGARFAVRLERMKVVSTESLMMAL
jgi:hypothetical protein